MTAVQQRHKVPITSEFGTPNGALHFWRPTKDWYTPTSCKGRVRASCVITPRSSLNFIRAVSCSCRCLQIHQVTRLIKPGDAGKTNLRTYACCGSFYFSTFVCRSFNEIPGAKKHLSSSKIEILVETHLCLLRVILLRSLELTTQRRRVDFLQ